MCYTQSATLVRTECMITQLVFEHALRIRMKAQVSNEKSDDQKAAEARPSSWVAADADGNLLANEEVTNGKPGNGGIAPVDGESLDSASTSAGSGTLPNVSDQAKVAENKSADLSGKLTNLVTTDLKNIVAGKDFLQLGLCLPALLLGHNVDISFVPVVSTPLVVAIGVWFLYSILGLRYVAVLSSVRVLTCLPVRSLAC